MAPASSCMTTAQPVRTSSPPRPRRRLLAWQRHRRPAAVGTIALRRCDRRARGAVRRRPTSEFGRTRKYARVSQISNVPRQMAARARRWSVPVRRRSSYLGRSSRTRCSRDEDFAYRLRTARLRGDADRGEPSRGTRSQAHHLDPACCHGRCRQRDHTREGSDGLVRSRFRDARACREPDGASQRDSGQSLGASLSAPIAVTQGASPASTTHASGKERKRVWRDVWPARRHPGSWASTAVTHQRPDRRARAIQIDGCDVLKSRSYTS